MSTKHLPGLLLISLFTACGVRTESPLELEATLVANEVTIDPIERLRQEGKELFNRRCVVCHMVDGMGQKGAYPPLVGSPFLLDADGSERATKIVLYGLRGHIEVNGQRYDGEMPNFNLTDRQIAGALTYVRSAWGNDAPAVTEDFVARIREQHGDRGPWTPYEILSQHPLRSK